MQNPDLLKIEIEMGWNQAHREAGSALWAVATNKELKWMT